MKEFTKNNSIKILLNFGAIWKNVELIKNLMKQNLKIL